MHNFFIFIFLFSIKANAFINIESLRGNSQSGLSRSAKILLNQQTGNTDKIIASASSLNSYKQTKNEYILIANMVYGESFEQKDTENGNLHLRYTRELSVLHFGELYTQYEYNKFKALNSRKLLGLGYRYTAKYLNFGFGAFNEYEEIENKPNQNAMRGNCYISSVVKNQTGLEFSTIAYIQPSLSKSHDTRVILNTGISQKVSTNLNIIIEYQSVYDDKPPENIKPLDTSLMFGLNFN